MDQMVINYLEKALELEEKGYIDEAVLLCDKMKEAFPNDTEIILTEKAKLEFRNQRYKDALIDFIQAYTITQNGDIYDLVLATYLEPNLAELKERYQHNLELLRKYPFYKNDFDSEQLDIFVLWMDEQVLYAVDTSQKRFWAFPYIAHSGQEQQEISVMLLNGLWVSELLYFKNKTKKSEPFLDQEIPFYLVYDRIGWMLFAQAADLEFLLADEIKRTVILAGENSFSAYFEDSMAIHPTKVFDKGIRGHYIQLLDSIRCQKDRCFAEYLKENNAYYKKNRYEIIQNIQRGKPRILFWTSRFTTILQYHIRDCLQAAQRMGCQTELLMESDGVHAVYALTYQKYIHEFKPDMIFNVDHFRFEYDIPDSLVWVVWIQDPLPFIMDKKTPARLTDRDLVLSHYISWKEFDEVAYNKKYLIEAPIPANASVYRQYELSFDELEQYACDICMVCHASDVDGHIDTILQRIPQNRREMVRSIYKGYQNYVYETGNVFYDKEIFAQYIQGAVQQHYSIVLKEKLLKAIVYDMWINFNQRVYRQALADWILDAGYVSVKLWGSGWQENAKYKDYAMGAAQNGKALSKIYQASKIVIGNNIMTTGAARAWETMLSGGFYLSNYIPPEYDAVDIRKIVQEGKEVAMFFDKEDLLHKIDYFLHHEKERQKMIQIGKKAALERMTFDRLMQKTVKEAGNRMKKEGQNE